MCVGQPTDGAVYASRVCTTSGGRLGRAEWCVGGGRCLIGSDTYERERQVRTARYATFRLPSLYRGYEQLCRLGSLSSRLRPRWAFGLSTLCAAGESPCPPSVYVFVIPQRSAVLSMRGALGVITMCHAVGELQCILTLSKLATMPFPGSSTLT